LPISNCEAERTNSKLELIENARRTTLHQEKLNSLVRLSAEREITDRLDFSGLRTIKNILRPIIGSGPIDEKLVKLIKKNLLLPLSMYISNIYFNGRVHQHENHNKY
jgi:hypothetical protein